MGAFLFTIMSSSSISKSTRIDIFNKYNGKCAYCGCELSADSFQIDHIIPKRRGDRNFIGRGSDKVNNLNPSCASCNSSKSTWSIDEWREEINLKFSRLEKYDSTFRLLLRFGIVEKLNYSTVFYFEKINQ